MANSAIDLGGIDAGKVAQIVSSSSGALASGTTTIPFDDTIPQNTEGNEFLTVSITPTATNSTLYITAVLILSATAGNSQMTVALFQDSTANALACTVDHNDANDQLVSTPLVYTMSAGTTSSTTFKIRAGTAGSGTTYLNGIAASAARRYGGVAASFLTVTEIKA